MKEEQIVNYGVRRTEIPHPDPELAKQGFTVDKYYWDPSEHIASCTRLDLLYYLRNIHNSKARICKN